MDRTPHQPLRKLFFAIAAAILAGFFVAPFAHSFADTATSTDFIIQDGFVGLFGGYATSTDFQVVNGGSAIGNGSATSTSFTAATGPVNFSDFAPSSYTWRWYGDVNDETPTSSLAGENISPSNIADGQPIKLRLDIRELSGVTGSADLKFRLQFSSSADFSTGGFVAEAGSCSGSSSWCYATSTGDTDNQVISTAVLSTTNACTSGIGPGCGTHNTSGISTSTFTQSAGATTEYEFTLVANGVANGTTYFFRPVNTADGSVVPLAPSSTYPSLVTQGATMTFVVSGLPQSTSTNGVVTNVSSSATAIPFGTLAIGTSTIAAQRLFVTTDAAYGYEIYVADDQPLENSHGNTVPGVLGTNNSPLSWSLGCPAVLSGCYGYHPGSPVLSGGSTRFAADDSYAAPTSSIAEVGYAGTPVTSSTMDMVYRLQVAGDQNTGSYKDNIMYVVAPSF